MYDDNFETRQDILRDKVESREPKFKLDLNFAFKDDFVADSERELLKELTNPYSNNQSVTISQSAQSYPESDEVCVIQEKSVENKALLKVTSNG